MPFLNSASKTPRVNREKQRRFRNGQISTMELICENSQRLLASTTLLKRDCSTGVFLRMLRKF